MSYPQTEIALGDSGDHLRNFSNTVEQTLQNNLTKRLCTLKVRSCSHDRAHHSQGPCNCQCIHRWPWPSCWPSPHHSCVSATSPFHYTGTCNWYPQPSTCIPPDLTTTAACPSPKLWTWRSCWGPNSLLSHCGPPPPQHMHSACKGTCSCYRPQQLKPMKHHTLLDQSHHPHLHLMPCTIRPGIIEFASPPPTGEGLPLMKSVHRIWKR